MPNETIPKTEGEEVAWSSEPGHGTRLIPAVAIKGVSFFSATLILRSPSYLEDLAFID